MKFLKNILLLFVLFCLFLSTVSAEFCSIDSTEECSTENLNNTITANNSLAKITLDKEICAYFFFGSGCPHCAKAEEFLDTIIENNPNFILKKFNAATDSELLQELYEKYDVPLEKRGKVPIMFIGDEYLFGDTKIIEKLEPIVQKYSESGSICPNPTTKIIEVSILQLVGLALVDAVNPCELAVLIILMTAILSRFPNDRKKALYAGLAFSLAVFLIYFAFGILIISGFKFLAGMSSLSGTWFFTILGAIAIVLGLLNIKDAIWYGGGGFIMEVPMQWRPKMKKIIRKTTSVPGAFIAGMLVSFFLTPCTSGPYFVAGGILSRLTLLEAIPYLLVYLIIFIAPMLIITLIVYFGFMAVEELAGWRERNLKLLHWVAGLLLFGLGIAMVLGLL